MAPRDTQFTAPRDTQFTGNEQSHFGGTQQRETATDSSQFASGPAALPAHAAPSRAPVQQGLGSITGETAPLNSIGGGGGF